MKYLFIWLIALVNCIVLGFASLLAVTGDGRGHLIKTVFLFGSVWVVAGLVWSLYLARRGTSSASFVPVTMSLPAAFLAGLVVMLADVGYDSVRPMPSEFAALCKDAGMKMIAAPSLRITSVAYDWEGKYPPQYNALQLGDNGHVRMLGGGTGPLYPAPIQFVESRCCRYESLPPNGEPYVRRDRTWNSIGIPSLTADALVMLSATPVQRPGIDPGTVQYDVVVSQRVDGRRLATLRYYHNDREKLGCGTTSAGVMSERAFVLRAIGVQ